MSVARVKRIEDWLGDLGKPPLLECERVELGEGAAFVLCDGFEDRATAVLEDLLARPAPRIDVILIKYCPGAPLNRTKEILERCGGAGVRVRTVDYSRSDRGGIGRRVAELVGYNRPVMLDVSGMSRMLIVQLIHEFAGEPRRFGEVIVAYAEAAGYPPGADQVEEVLNAGAEELARAKVFISSGVYDVAVVPELSSVALQGQPIRGIFFPSFNYYQLLAFCGEVQPARMSIIHGVPHLEENAWRSGVIRQLNGIADLTNVEEHYVSTLDYRGTLECLVEIYRRHAALERLVLSPTGSKMQAVACGIFRAAMQDVQVVYPTPLTYAEPREVTRGVSKKYILSLNAFGDVLPHDIPEHR